jgi:hypothetical protein
MDGDGVLPGSSSASPPPTASLHGLLLAGSDRRGREADDWSDVRSHVLSDPPSAAASYYRDETPLQLALRARERGRRAEKSCESDTSTTGEQPPREVTTRIDALEALALADPPSVLGRRDAEGRTALHTAASSGRSADVLRWLVDAERRLAEEEACMAGSVDDSNSGCHYHSSRERNASLRTDHPGGALPLHLAAACPSFDPPSDDYDTSCGEAALVSSLIICPITPAMLASFESTEAVREAYPQAVWEEDCDGETPLHSSAWGGVGSLVSLLVGVAESSSSEDRGASLRRAAAAEDGRGKTPLDRACERLCCMCVHAKAAEGRGDGRRDEPKSGGTLFLRESSARNGDPFGPGPADDPFAPPEAGSGRRASFVRTGSSRRRRIPGCGSSFRGSSRSLSSSFVGGTGGLELDDGEDGGSNNHNHDPASISRLRESFVLTRRPVHPRFGLEKLDDDLLIQG